MKSTDSTIERKEARKQESSNSDPEESKQAKGEAHMENSPKNLIKSSKIHFIVDEN